MSLQLMKERIKSGGITPRQSKINDAHRLLNYGFKHDTAYADSVYFWLPGAEPRKGPHIAIKLYDRKHSSAAGNTIAFQTQITDVLEVGDYLYDEADNIYWICTESFNMDGIHYKGKLTQCNWYLRWQKKDGSILEYPCQDINSTQYNSGVSGNNIVTLGSTQHMETVQANDDTLALASPQRFYISRTNDVPYIITQNDTTACNYGKGLCKITVTQDQNSLSDRPDLGICDYCPPATLPEPPSPDSSGLLVSISGGTRLRCGRFRTWTVTVMDRNGDVVTGYDCEWSVRSDFNVCKTINENNIQLKVDDERLIGRSFLLSVKVDASSFKDIEITIIEGL